MNRRKSLETDQISTQPPDWEISWPHGVCARKGSAHRRNYSRNKRRIDFVPPAVQFSQENGAGTVPLIELHVGPDDLVPGVTFPSTSVRSGGNLAGKPKPGTIK